MVAADFTFKGRLEQNSFVEFARHRARRLDIALDLGAISHESAQMSVAGPEDLVDAFEMALSLGPYDCIIYEIDRKNRLRT